MPSSSVLVLLQEPGVLGFVITKVRLFEGISLWVSLEPSSGIYDTGKTVKVV